MPSRWATTPAITAGGPEYSCCLGKVVMMESLDGRQRGYMLRVG
jgi:hypothetical protein